MSIFIPADSRHAGRHSTQSAENWKQPDIEHDGLAMFTHQIGVGGAS